jgi:hypothetical protein
MRPVTRTQARALVTTAFVLLAVSAAGCEAKGVGGGSCADLHGCGGNFVGDWLVNGACQYLVNSPETSPPLPPGYTTPQNSSVVQPVQTNTGDWCQGLVLLPDSTMPGGLMIGNTNFFEAPEKFMMGTLEFRSDNTYTFALTSVAASTEHLSQACIQAHGASPTCADLEMALAMAPNPNYNNVHCSDSTADGGGCDCSLQIGDSGFDQGTWALDSTQPVVYETSTNAGKGPQAASFCVSPDNTQLTLSGLDGATLIGGPAGLRTLTATRTAAMASPTQQ